MQDRIRNMTDETQELDQNQERALQVVTQQPLENFDVEELTVRMKRKMSAGLRLLLKINGHLQQYAVFEYIAHNHIEANKYKVLYEAEKAQAEAQGYEFGINPESGRFIIIKEPEEDINIKAAKIIDAEKAKQITAAYFDEQLLETQKEQFQVQQQFDFAASNQKYADIAIHGSRLEAISNRIALIEQYKDGVLEALSQL